MYTEMLTKAWNIVNIHVWASLYKGSCLGKWVSGEKVGRGMRVAEGLEGGSIEIFEASN